MPSLCFWHNLWVFLHVRKVGLDLTKNHLHKIKKYPYLIKIKFMIIWDHFWSSRINHSGDMTGIITVGEISTFFGKMEEDF